MTIDLLYPLVTEAIRRAETLEDLRAPGTRSAYLDVSLLEEKVAEILPASDPEGELARRGAVRAALTAKEPARAQQLAERFLAETECSTKLRDDLAQLLAQADRAAAARFPTVAARFGIQEVRRIARAFIQQGAPFPIG